MKRSVIYPSRLMRACQRYWRLVATFQNWPVFLAYKFGWLGHDAIRLTTRLQLNVEIPWALKFAFKDIFLHAAYSLPAILERLPAAPVVIDVGANAGFFSLYALHQRPAARCFSFEPLPANFQQLQRNRDRNPSADWRIFPVAVAGKNGELQLYCASGDCLCTEATINPTSGQTEDAATFRHPVEARTLASIFESESIEHCDWLKLDCEGAEYEILYQTSLDIFQRISVICLEIHPWYPQRKNAVALPDFLESQGFDIFFADDAVVYALRRR